MPTLNFDSTGRNINQIETLWPVLTQAHSGPPEEITAAQEQFLMRYHQAVRRYLLACLGNQDAADELWQDFSLRFVRGDFRNANPEKGRFRDLLKSALYHLIVDYHKRRQRGMPQLGSGAPEPAADESSTFDSDRQFLDNWRANLLAKAWEALAEEERRTGRPVHTVLHFRAQHSRMESAQMAARLSERLGREVSADWVRQWIHKAREKFAEFLLAEVAASLRDNEPEAVERELITLDLYRYCKSALARWRQGR